jgi:hypothetical protein
VKVLNDWSSSANAIIYTQHEPATKLDLWHVPLSGGAAQPLVNTPFNEAQARISPDGRSFLIDARRDGTRAPITVLLHWASGLATPPAVAHGARDTNEMERRTRRAP